VPQSCSKFAASIIDLLPPIEVRDQMNQCHPAKPTSVEESVIFMDFQEGFLGELNASNTILHYITLHNNSDLSRPNETHYSMQHNSNRLVSRNRHLYTPLAQCSMVDIN